MLDSFLPERGLETPIVERLQMTRLLEALFAESQLAFPLKLRHDSTLTPDFQLSMGPRSYSVEASRIARRNVEQSKLIQETRSLGAFSPTTFYSDKKPLSEAQIIQQGFLVQPMSYPPAIKDTKRVWLNCLAERLKKKTEQRAKKHFQHCDYEWLLLWDQLPIDVWPGESRLYDVESVLSPYWNADWFTKVFIHHSRFDWLIVCSAAGAVLFLRQRNK